MGPRESSCVRDERRAATCLEPLPSRLGKGRGLGRGAPGNAHTEPNRAPPTHPPTSPHYPPRMATHPRDWTRVSTGSQWERDFAYSRALRAGPLVFLTGTVARPPDNITDAFAPHGPLRSAHAQTLRCYEIIESALFKLGLDRTAITRSRIFVTDITLAPEFGRAHAEFFKDHRPCLTQVGVSALIAPEYLVEIECDAVALDEWRLRCDE